MNYKSPTNKHKQTNEKTAIHKACLHYRRRIKAPYWQKKLIFYAVEAYKSNNNKSIYAGQVYCDGATVRGCWISGVRAAGVLQRIYTAPGSKKLHACHVTKWLRFFII
jgi:hypothetical protein